MSGDPSGLWRPTQLFIILDIAFDIFINEGAHIYISVEIQFGCILDPENGVSMRGTTPVSIAAICEVLFKSMNFFVSIIKIAKKVSLSIFKFCSVLQEALVHNFSKLADVTSALDLYLMQHLYLTA